MSDASAQELIAATRRLRQSLGMSQRELARLAGVPESALDQPPAAALRGRLDEIARILAKATAMSGDLDRAVTWFRRKSLPAHDGRTAEQLVARGQAAAVMAHLDDLDDGNHA